MSDKVQEARDRAAKAQRDLEQAQIDARNADFEAKERAKQEKLDGIAKIKQAMREALLAEVVKLKPTAVLAGHRITITEGEYEDSVSIGLVDENEFGYRSNGKIRLTISRSYGDTKQFPQKKDGTHSYAAAAQYAVELFDRAKRDRERYDEKDRLRSANRPIADALNKEFGGSKVDPSQYNEGKVHVRFEINEELTEEQARDLLTLYRDMKDRIGVMKIVADRLKEG